MNLATSEYVNAFLNGHGRKRYGRSGISEGPVRVLQRRRMQVASVTLEDPVQSNVRSIEVVAEEQSQENARDNNVVADAALKIKNDYLVKFTAKQKEQILVLTNVIKKFQEAGEQPKCCQVPYVKKMMTDVSCKLLISQYSFSSMYPSEDTIIECLLASFQVSVEDEVTRSTFAKEWAIYRKGEKGIRGVAYDNIILRRGNMTRELKNHLFTVLELPRPPPQSGEEAEDEWRRRVEEIKLDGKWRISCDTGVRDPYGSVAVHGAISYVMLGRCYRKDVPVLITLEQAGFFFHVMELALNFKTLSEGRLTSHIHQMKMKEEDIKKNMHLMRRIYIVEKGGHEDFDDGDDNVILDSL